MRKRLSRFATPAALLIAAVMLGGCNTIEGMGEDIQAAGSALSNSSEKARD